MCRSSEARRSPSPRGVSSHLVLSRPVSGLLDDSDNGGHGHGEVLTYLYRSRKEIPVKLEREQAGWLVAGGST